MTMQTDETTASADLDSLEAIAGSMGEQAEDEQDEDEGEDAPEVEESDDEAEDAESEEDDDPEIDLGDIKLKKSELKAGYMKDADYRQKTAAAAEAKRHAEAEHQQARAEREYYANHLDVTLDRLQSQLIGSQQELVELAQTDPATWVAENAKFQQRMTEYQSALAERQAIGQRQQAEEQAAQIAYVREQQSLLQDMLPEWKDPKVRDSEANGIAKFLNDNGYSDDELPMLQDARALMIVRKAWKAEQQARARESAQAKQAKPQPGTVIKPGAPKSVKPNLALKDARERLSRDPNSLEALGAFVHASSKR